MTATQMSASFVCHAPLQSCVHQRRNPIQRRRPACACHAASSSAPPPPPTTTTPTTPTTPTPTPHLSSAPFTVDDVPRLLHDRGAQRRFLRTVWNRTPFLLPQLFPDFTSPVTPDDLAALSALSEHRARMIHTHHPQQAPSTPTTYTLRNGPFDDTVWETLPTESPRSIPWTLLVQNLELSVPHAVSLMDAFCDFLPVWRVADIQASYAVTGGGVGPHVDDYDVFLVQASGTRQWKFSSSSPPISHARERELLDPNNTTVRVLREEEVRWDTCVTMKQGDVLYVPPRFVHHGTALDDECVTLSIGFRAPTAAQLAATWVYHRIESLGLDERFYVDPVVRNDCDGDGVRDDDDDDDDDEHPAAMSKQAADAAFDLVRQAITGDAEDDIDEAHRKENIKKNEGSAVARREFQRWFAKEMSRSKVFNDDDYDDDDDVDTDNSDEVMVKKGDQDAAADNSVEIKMDKDMNIDMDSIMHIIFDADDQTDSVRVQQRPGSTFLYTSDNTTWSSSNYRNNSLSAAAADDGVNASSPSSTRTRTPQKTSMWVNGRRWVVDSVETAQFLCAKRSRRCEEYREIARRSTSSNGEVSFQTMVRRLLKSGLLKVVDLDDYDDDDDEC